jgi:hypothetical protein
MSKTKIIVIGVFATVAVALGITTIVLVNQPNQGATANQQQQPATEQSENKVSFVAEAGKTVLEQLQAKVTVELKESSFGPYVDSINGKVGGTDAKYWTFYVDGQMAQVGAGEYITNGGELIEWKFE